MNDFKDDMTALVDIMLMAICGEAISEGVSCRTSDVAVDGDEGRFNLNFGGRLFTVVITENVE